MNRHIWRCVTDGPGHPGLHLVLTVVTPTGGRYSIFQKLPNKMLSFKSPRSWLEALRWAQNCLLARQSALSQHATLQSVLKGATQQ